MTPARLGEVVAAMSEASDRSLADLETERQRLSLDAPIGLRCWVVDGECCTGSVLGVGR